MKEMGELPCRIGLDCTLVLAEMGKAVEVAKGSRVRVMCGGGRVENVREGRSESEVSMGPFSSKEER